MREKDENLISLSDWAVLNRINPKTARRKAEKGLIPAVKIGRNWLIDRDAENVDNRRKTVKAVVKKDENQQRTYQTVFNIVLDEKLAKRVDDFIDDYMYISSEQAVVELIERAVDEYEKNKRKRHIEQQKYFL